MVGYSQDYFNLIVEAVKEKLGKPNLQVRLIPITSQNRIPLLQNGTFDFECGSTTNISLANNKLIFEYYFYCWYTFTCEKETVELKILLILRAKNVVVTSGTTSEMLLNKLNDEKKNEYAHYWRKRSWRLIPYT